MQPTIRNEFVHAVCKIVVDQLYQEDIKGCFVAQFQGFEAPVDIAENPAEGRNDQQADCKKGGTPIGNDLGNVIRIGKQVSKVCADAHQIRAENPENNPLGNKGDRVGNGIADEFFPPQRFCCKPALWI